MVWVYRQGSSLIIASGGTPPCLSLWERCPVRTLGGEGLSVSQQPSQSPAVTALPEGEPSGGAFRSWVRFGWVHPFRKVSPFLIRPGFAGPPSPRGKDFLSVNYQVTNWGTAGGYSRGRRGRAPALRKVRPFYPKLLRCNEPGAPQRWWSTARVAGSNRLRRHVASRRRIGCLGLGCGRRIPGLGHGGLPGGGDGGACPRR